MQQKNTFNLFSENADRTGVVIGTGPSLTHEQIEQVSHLKKFGCNRAFEFDLDVLLACNNQFWDHYWPEVKDLRCHKWTTRPEAANKYPINYIYEKWEPGLSTDKSYICAHHGSGPQIVNLALHYGVTRMLLIGWDMCYREKRHYFGEYPQALQHWPRTGPNGELAGLIKEMETIKPGDYGIEIINCTPSSAMTCFTMGELEDYI